MTDDVSTQLQWEVGQQQKELERIEVKLDSSVSQLRNDVEQLGADMQHMFEQIIGRIDQMDKGKVQVDPVEEDVRSKLGIDSPSIVSGQAGVTGNQWMKDDPTCFDLAGMVVWNVPNLRVKILKVGL